MMLPADAALSGSIEIEAFSATAPLHSGAAKESGKASEAAEKGDSFPQILEDVQGSSGKAEALAAGGSPKPQSAEAAAADEKPAARLSESSAAGGKGKALLASLKKEIPAADAEEAVEIAQALGASPALLLKNAEDVKVSSINIEFSDVADAEEDAGGGLAFAGSLLELGDAAALEREGQPASLLAEAAPARLESLAGIEAEGAAVIEADGLLAKSGLESLEAAAAPLGQEEAALLGERGTEALEAEGEKPAIAVKDLRSSDRLASRGGAAESAEGRLAAAPSPADAPSAGASANVEGFELSGKEGGGSSLAAGFSAQGSQRSEAGSGSGAAATASFAERLAAELRDSVPELVRAGQIVLRNGGEGTIRLALQPEALGAVRIHLEMSGDKKIAGKITVSSREAWDAFTESMDSLVAAFAEEGFDSAGFDLSWSGRDGGAPSGGKVSAPFYASSVADVMPGEELADDYSMEAAPRRAGARHSINLFA